jgi:DNA-binding beta-propeller fold protein YncE
MRTSWLQGVAKKRIRLSTIGVISLSIMVFFLLFFDYFYFSDRPLPVVDLPYFTSLRTPGFVSVIDRFQTSDLKSPTGVAVGKDGNVYVADSGNNRVLVYDKDGNSLRQFGKFGTLNGELNYPYCITVDQNNNIYVGQFKAPRIQVFDSRGKLIRKIDESSAKTLVAPLAMTVDKLGILYVANQDGRVLVLDGKGGELLKSFANAGSDFGNLNYPKGIAVDDQKVYVADTNNVRVQVYEKNGKHLVQANANALKVGMPAGLSLSQSGELFLVDSFSSRVNVYDTNLKFISTIGQKGTAEGQLSFPVGVAVDQFDKVYIADTANNRISIFQR